MTCESEALIRIALIISVDQLWQHQNQVVVTGPLSFDANTRCYFATSLTTARVSVLPIVTYYLKTVFMSYVAHKLVLSRRAHEYVFCAWSVQALIANVQVSFLRLIIKYISHNMTYNTQEPLLLCFVVQLYSFHFWSDVLLQIIWDLW